MHKIAVIGSINTDYFIESQVLPDIGETVLGKSFFVSIGGKGSNQAVAASRLGGQVSFFASLGDDDNGEMVKRRLQDENINLSKIQIVEGMPTGAAFVELCNGNNRITVVSGANDSTDVAYVEKTLKELMEHDVFVFQLEMPMETIEYLVPKLYEQGKTIILNPAPAQYLDSNLVEQVTYIIPNEHEFKINFSSDEAMEALLKRYPNKLIVTCGSEGVQFFDGEDIIMVPSMKVDAVDTTGAGDTFVGSFAVAIAEGENLADAIKFGNIAAGLSVTQKGAQTGMPYRPEVEKYLMREGHCNEEEGQAQAN